jgi:tetratricopeptide (TPR) repeat protein
LNRPFYSKCLILNGVLLILLGLVRMPLSFSADYDMATLKTVLVKLHQRYEESVKTNAQLTQQVQQLKAQLKTSAQVTTYAYQPPLTKGMSLVPQSMLGLQNQLVQLQDENKALKDRLQSAGVAHSSKMDLTQAHQELQQALLTIQDQQRQITSLSERIEALQSMQAQAPVTLTGRDATVVQTPAPSSSSVEGSSNGAAASVTPASVQVVTMVNQASELRKHGKWQAAEAILLKALQISPEEATVYYNLGNTYAGQNKLSEAVGAYTKAISLRSGFAQAYYNLGIVYQRLEEPVQAKKYLDFYLTLEPTCSNRADVEALIQSL